MKKLKVIGLMALIVTVLSMGLGGVAKATTYTSADVSLHNTAADCWVVVNNNVYNLTSFISRHPGGSAVITAQCGKDGTATFNSGPHSSTTLNAISSLILGTLSNTPPPATGVTVSAGSSQTIYVPTNTVTLTGSATAVSPATIATYAWTQIGGPATATIVTPATASTTINGLNITGTYVFKLTATDNSTPTAKVGSATVNVIVSPTVPNNPPVRNYKSKLEINSNGKINLQGEVTAVGNGTLTVKVWGIVFTVNIINTNFTGVVTSTADYKVGDFVSVNGRLDVTASTPTISARNVKNMSAQISGEWNKKLLELLREKNKKEKENKHED